MGCKNLANTVPVLKNNATSFIDSPQAETATTTTMMAAAAAEKSTATSPDQNSDHNSVNTNLSAAQTVMIYRHVQTPG